MAKYHYNAVLGRMVLTEPRKPRRVRVYLEDDSYILAPKSEVQHLVGVTEYGDLIVRTDEPIFKEGEYLGLTSCCGATAKGCDGYVGCRMCYGECDTALGAPLRDSDIYLKVRAS
jgi:hypothetical protein